MKDLRRNMDGYDCGILYADKKVGEVMAKLQELGVYEDTMIIVSSDHGENQGELGIYGEHGTSDLITHRIPMIVKMPGQRKPHVDNGLHYNIDLLPTFADMVGQDKRASWDGKSFYPALTEQNECGWDYLVLSQCAHVLQRSVRWGDYIYIRTYHDGYHLFPDEMLFNVKEDFHEQHNLAEERPDLCGHGARLLLDWETRMMKSSKSATDPLWTVFQEGGPLHARGHLPKYCERLEATGRGWAVEELKKRHPYEFKKA
jgi:arylsulfatase A-like enzyme